MPARDLSSLLLRNKSLKGNTRATELFFSDLFDLLRLSLIALFRYKERLETKYIKPRKLRGNSETLIGSAWTFLEKGSDDFRDGLPPEANYDYIKKVRVVYEYIVVGLVNLQELF